MRRFVSYLRKTTSDCDKNCCIVLPKTTTSRRQYCDNDCRRSRRRHTVLYHIDRVVSNCIILQGSTLQARDVAGSRQGIATAMDRIKNNRRRRGCDKSVSLSGPVECPLIDSSPSDSSRIATIEDRDRKDKRSTTTYRTYYGRRIGRDKSVGSSRPAK